MIENFKHSLYFPVASYFKFFAKIHLSLWRPKIVVVTGSFGKTTVLELIKSGLGDRAKYSDHANSAFGISFDILGLHRKTLLPNEWIGLILAAPIRAFKKPQREQIYIVEADCDRPNEGKFLASLLTPEVTLWVGAGRAHTLNFDHLVGHGFNSVEKAISHEFGYFAQYAKKLVVIDEASSMMKSEIKRTKAEVKAISEKSLGEYKLNSSSTEFIIDGRSFTFRDLLPRENFLSVAMANALFDYLKIEDVNFDNFNLPPGRSNVFSGIKNTTIIDSTYNAPPKGFEAVVKMFSEYPSEIKWVVAADMRELGAEEAEEHENLAKIIGAGAFDKVILFGQKVEKYTYPALVKKIGKTKVKIVATHKELLSYLKYNLPEGTAILFKGAAGMSLEAVVEKLLSDKNDIEKLPRRETIYERKRKNLGLPMV